MFKFFILCLMAIVALTTAKPGIVSPLAYSSPVISTAALPYTAGYAALPYYGSYASPYYGSFVGSHYASPYTAATFGGGYHHPYGSFILRR
ncbi:uncharacterized protein LOC142236229 [Haematobia irritans]|uniref:uncharacterized protein LOC142236229 n=1 Tax=Haematobia irritans TaxID=7368 RepID=UPI003F4F68D2